MVRRQPGAVAGHRPVGGAGEGDEGRRAGLRKGRKVDLTRRQLVEGAGCQFKFSKLGFHSLQLEVNKRLYMDQATLQKHVGFVRLQVDLMALLDAIAERFGRG